MALPFRTIGKIDSVHTNSVVEDFELVQEFLARFGYLSAASYEKGKLDRVTSEALEKYQSRNGLHVSGNFTQATRRQMRSFRCGLPDMHRGLAASTLCKWEKPLLRFAFDWGTDDVNGREEFGAVRKAFASWSSVTGLEFEEVVFSDAPDIQIGWRASDDPDYELSGVVAHSDYPIGCSVSTGQLPLPIHFNSQFRWAVEAASNAFDIESVALHEIGHILGLGHLSDKNAVMFEQIFVGSLNRVLTENDIEAIAALYG